jgi:hypothetical protein
MDIYVIDGTYELFRYFYAVPSAKDTRGQEIGAVRGVLGSILSLIEQAGQFSRTQGLRRKLSEPRTAGPRLSA